MSGIGNITLAAMGSFHVGGRALQISGLPPRRVALSAGFDDYLHDPNGAFWIEQAYVQYFIPAVLRDAIPILLIHGGGMTGACWETTPDGRPGWLELLLRAGHAVYVIDNVERGRAGFNIHPREWAGEPLMRSAEQAWSLFRLGAPEHFGSRLPYPGQRFPIAAFDTFMLQGVPRWLGNNAVQQAALLQAIQRIGPCFLVGHSQGGGHALAATAAAPSQVRGCVLLEPHGAAVAAPRAGPVPPVLLIRGDYLDCSDTWRALDASAGRMLDAWRQAGRADTLDLNAHGDPGHSHMFMMDDGHEKILHGMLAWLSQCGNRAPSQETSVP